MTATAAPRPRSRTGARVAIAVAFLLGFGWRVYGAVSNLLAWLGLAAASGGQLNATAWVVLILGIVIPVAAAVIGLVLGRHRGPGSLALVLLLALCVSEALSLGQLAFFLSVAGTL